VFDRSVASLQFLIDATVRGLPQQLFDDGIEALQRLADDHAGANGKIEAELKAIDQQDALDALGTPPSDLTDQLCDLDDEWRDIADDTTLWLEQTLMFGRLPQSEGPPVDPRATPFRYQYLTERGHTLLPLPTFLEHCAGSLDFIPSARYGRAIKTAPFTFHRRTVVSKQGRAAGLRLLRYGEPFLVGVSAITDGDDRGRSFALWREVGGYSAEQIADIFLRFDFIAEVDLRQALLTLSDHGMDTVAARAALRRRGDLALPPRFSTIWLDSTLTQVRDPKLRELLEAPYLPDHRSGKYRDTNINARRWKRVKTMRLDPVAHWSELCRQGRERAETCLRSDPEFLELLRTAGSEAATIDFSRISQLEVRERQNPDAGTAQLDLERSIAAKMHDGILHPSVRLETIGSVFLTGDSAATFRIVGGE
jgi:ATP-dependent helicase HepA